MKASRSVVLIIAAVMVGSACQRRELISFYKVPFSCQAVNSIGCGSHAKPLLKALAVNSGISEARINHQGTIIAIVWKEAPSLSVIGEVFSPFNVPVDELMGEAHEEAAAGWVNRDDWLTSAQVDQLNLEEAEVLTGRLMKSLMNNNVIKDTATIGPMSNQIKDVFVEYLLNHDPYSTRDDADLKSLEKRIFEIGEAHFGKDKMPPVGIRRFDKH